MKPLLQNTLSVLPSSRCVALLSFDASVNIFFYTPTLNERDAQADSDELVRLRGEGSPAGDRAGHLTTEQRLYKLIQSACFSRPHIIV